MMLKERINRAFDQAEFYGKTKTVALPSLWIAVFKSRMLDPPPKSAPV
jgi:hypothetical protein